MSMPRKYKDMWEAIHKEVAPTGATFTFEPTSKHIKVRLYYKGGSKLVIMSATTSDWRAEKNRIRDVRHAIASLQQPTV
jgi:hypothetical protein